MDRIAAMNEELMRPDRPLVVLSAFSVLTWLVGGTKAADSNKLIQIICKDSFP